MNVSTPPPYPPGSPRKSALREAAGIVLISVVLAITANALSPRGIPLVGDFSKGAAWANRSEKELAELPAEIGADEVEAAIAAQDSELVLVIDARLPEDYVAGHIPTALNLPADHFDAAFPALSDTLKAASRLIVYCDGGDCELSHDLATHLKEKGYKAVQLFTGGINGWIGAGKTVKEGKDP